MLRPTPAGLLTIVPPVAAVAAWCAAISTFGWEGLAAGAGLVPAAAAALLDLRTHRIPDRLALLGALPIVSYVALGNHRTGIVAALLAGALGMAGPLLCLHLMSPEAMGWGDVKLAAVLGSSLAVIDARLGIVALALASAATLMFAVAARRSGLPFAPGLVGAAAAVLTAVSTGALGFPR
jgi:leader peptidase (prepilin peptidase)/N-methyltransferase